MLATNTDGQTSSYQTALVEQESKERELAYQLATIKSQADLQAYVAQRPNASPLNSLSPGAKQRFLQSLVFTDLGLASFDYRDLRSELTATQIYQLLGLFGVQRSTSSIPGLRIAGPSDAAIIAFSENPVIGDYPDYWRESRATCRPSTGAVCIGGNC